VRQAVFFIKVQYFEVEVILRVLQMGGLGLENIFEKIPILEKGERFVLGIDGLSRAGKTTIVKKIKNHLQENGVSVCIIHIDDHIVERKRRYTTEYEQWYEYYYLQWDLVYLKENLFKKIKKSNELNLLTYDNSADVQKLKAVRVPETCLIIIEGVFLQRKEWRGFYDYMIYLDCPREKRFERENAEAKRDIEKFRNRYWKAEDYYQKMENPMQQADLVIQN
jgi:uridine kinase